MVCKPKENTSGRARPSDSLYQLRDKSQEEEEASKIVAHVRSQFEGQGVSEPERGKADLPQARETDGKAVVELGQRGGRG